MLSGQHEGAKSQHDRTGHQVQDAILVVGQINFAFQSHRILLWYSFQSPDQFVFYISLFFKLV